MAVYLLTVDAATGKYGKGGLATGVGGFATQEYDVVTAQTSFSVTQVFSSLSVIDVWVNGRKVREGSTNDFQRNTSLNTVVFNSNVLANAWVEIRVYP